MNSFVDLLKRIRGPLEIIGGITLIIIGAAGLLLPVLPGWVLIILGVAILGERTWLSRFIIRNMPAKIKDKFKLHKKIG